MDDTAKGGLTQFFYYDSSHSKISNNIVIWRLLGPKIKNDNSLKLRKAILRFLTQLQ